MDVRVFADIESLMQHVPAWEDLAASALETNPFFEHWMLLPAIRHFAAGRKITVLGVFDSDRACAQLRGIFPLERIRPYRSLPLSAWSLWRYNHCPLSMPLIRADCAAEVLSAFCGWICSPDANCDVLDFQNVPGDGAFHQLIVDEFHRMGTIPLVWELYTRALFRPAESAEQYFSLALSGKHRKALRRRTALLADLGQLDYKVIGPEANIEEWIESFLRIERSGWKGRERSAMACRPTNRGFFAEVVTEAFRRNRLLMAAMTVDGRIIAQNCYFLGGRGSFHFKPAFDEEFARFSPGFHMECELIRYLHSKPAIEWMDSCTSSDNEMYNRLFLSRRTIQSLIVPVRGGTGGLIVSLIPALRSLKRAVRQIIRPVEKAEPGKQAEWAS